MTNQERPRGRKEAAGEHTQPRLYDPMPASGRNRNSSSEYRCLTGKGGGVPQQQQQKTKTKTKKTPMHGQQAIILEKNKKEEGGGRGRGESRSKEQQQQQHPPPLLIHTRSHQVNPNCRARRVPLCRRPLLAARRSGGDGDVDVSSDVVPFRGV